MEIKAEVARLNELAKVSVEIQIFAGKQAVRFESARPYDHVPHPMLATEFRQIHDVGTPCQLGVESIKGQYTLNDRAFFGLPNVAGKMSIRPCGIEFNEYDGFPHCFPKPSIVLLVFRHSIERRNRFLDRAHPTRTNERI